MLYEARLFFGIIAQITDRKRASKRYTFVFEHHWKHCSAALPATVSSPNPFYHLTRIIGLASALCVIASAHVPHILTSCTAEMDLTTENENLLSHTHTHTYTHNDISNDNDDQAHAGQNVCFSPIDLDSVAHARNVCTWYKSKNAMKQFKHCEQKMCKQKK